MCVSSFIFIVSSVFPSSQFEYHPARVSIYVSPRATTIWHAVYLQLEKEISLLLFYLVRKLLYWFIFLEKVQASPDAELFLASEFSFYFFAISCAFRFENDQVRERIWKREITVLENDCARDSTFMSSWSTP